MKLAIVGSRSFTNEKYVAAVLKHFVRPALVVSGGAKGVDTIAEHWANEHDIPTCIFPAEWKKFGRAAGPIRNKFIVDKADVVLAFMFPGSKGTANSVALAKKAKKPLIVVDPSTNEITLFNCSVDDHSIFIERI